MQPKKSLVRIVVNQDKKVMIDPTGKQSGRGAYVSLNPEKIAAAEKSGVLARSLKTKIDSSFYQELYAYVDHQKARKELFGDK